MHSQMVRPQDHDHAVGEGEDEHHHEKKSVLKKVKAKAKKLKDTLKLHGHEHHDPDQGQDYHDQDTPDDHDLDEEDDEDEEMADDPAVHGVSGLHTTLVKNSDPEQTWNPGDTRNYYGSSESAMGGQEPHLQRSSEFKSYSPHQQDEGNRVDVERISGIKEKPYTPVSSPAPFNAGIPEQPKAVDPIAGFSEEQKAIRGQPEISMKNSVPFEEDPYAPNKIGTAPTNYETKVNDPTGQGEEIESSSIVQQLGQMGISDEPKPKPREFNSVFPTGSHDQFTPEPSPPVPISSSENPQFSEKSSDAPKSDQEVPAQSTYTGKISAATSAVAGKAISAKNAVASKLGYGEQSHEGEHQAKGTSVAPLEYGKKIAATVTEKLTPVYGKVAETGSNLMSKAQGSYKSNETARETGTVVEGQDKGVSVKGFLSEKLMPGEEDRALSAVISEALHKQKGEGEVTESEEVRRRLGGSGGEEEAAATEKLEAVAGGGVVGKIKEVVGSLMGKGAGNRVSEQRTSIGDERFVVSESGETGERRLQESGN